MRSERWTTTATSPRRPRTPWTNGSRSAVSFGPGSTTRSCGASDYHGNATITAMTGERGAVAGSHRQRRHRERLRVELATGDAERWTLAATAGIPGQCVPSRRDGVPPAHRCGRGDPCERCRGREPGDDHKPCGRAASTLATSTASVEYDLLVPPSEHRRPPDHATRRQRTSHGTVAELLGGRDEPRHRGGRAGIERRHGLRVTSRCGDA